MADVNFIRIRRRASGGAAGAPATLKSAELAYNMADGDFYAGFGDNGSGVATSIKKFASDDFIGNVPAGGTTGQVLSKVSATDGDWAWAAPQGSTYTASGDGIELTGTNFALNYTEIATGISLSNYATDAELTSGLAGKANTSHTHAASDITSGVFDIARIPVLPGNTTITSSSNIAALDAGQQANIEEGTIVTTTDGRRWVYSGIGSKTAEASYIELADITPEWSVIGSKPANVTALGGLTGAADKIAYFTGSGAMSVVDFTTQARALLDDTSFSAMRTTLELGTMATQNASAVAITGGTIAGVDIDGGTF